MMRQVAPGAWQPLSWGHATMQGPRSRVFDLTGQMVIEGCTVGWRGDLTYGGEVVELVTERVVRVRGGNGREALLTVAELHVHQARP